MKLDIIILKGRVTVSDKDALHSSLVHYTEEH